MVLVVDAAILATLAIVTAHKAAGPAHAIEQIRVVIVTIASLVGLADEFDELLSGGGIGRVASPYHAIADTA